MKPDFKRTEKSKRREPGKIYCVINRSFEGTDAGIRKTPLFIPFMDFELVV